jgi:hypothetical protein
MSHVNLRVDAPEYKGKFQAIKDYILFSLGWPMVRVELEDRHLTLAIIDAITLWYKKAGYIEYNYRIAIPNGNIVPIPADIRPVTIRDILFNPQLVDSFSRGLVMSGDEDELGKYVFPMQGFNNLLANFDMVGYYMFTQRLDDFRKIVGIDRWWDIMNGQIHLYPAAASFPEIAIVYRALPEEAEIESENWIREYALAKAKHMLATVRGKLTGFQVAGGNLSGDADTLRSEAKEEMAALRTELDSLQRPLPLLQV